MKSRIAVLMVFAGLLPAILARAQSAHQANPANPGVTDGKLAPDQRGPALTGVRRPLYRLRKSDVVEVKFTFSPEFDQQLTIQPDGLISLKGAGDLAAEGSTISDLREAVRQAYESVLRDPEVSVILKDFERPFFVAGGQVGHPGKYELRSPTSVAEAVAIAGGFTEQAKHSQVVLFRKITDGVVESHVVNVKACWLLETSMKTWNSGPATCYLCRKTGFQK